MKNLCKSKFEMIIYFTLFTTLLCSNLQFSANNQLQTSNTLKDAPSPFDLKKLRSYMYIVAGTLFKYAVRLNEINRIECLSIDNKYCVSFATQKDFDNMLNNADAVTALNNGGFLECDATHIAKWPIGNPYNVNDHWCKVAKEKIYNQWLCGDFTGLSISIWVDFDSKRMFCASTDGNTCGNYNVDACKILSNSFGITKVDMGYFNSIRSSKAADINGRVFLYRDVFQLQRKALDTIVATSLGYMEKLSYNTLSIANFNVPLPLAFLKFNIVIPPVGPMGTVASRTYTKVKYILKLDDNAILVKENIYPYDVKVKSLDFSGVAPEVGKGNHTLKIDMISYNSNTLFDGNVSVSLEGYYKIIE